MFEEGSISGSTKKCTLCGKIVFFLPKNTQTHAMKWVHFNKREKIVTDIALFLYYIVPDKIHTRM